MILIKRHAVVSSVIRRRQLLRSEFTVIQSLALNRWCPRVTGRFCAHCMWAFANVEKAAMGYAAIAVALLGFAIGTFFRLQVLLVVIALLLLFSIVFSFSSGLSFSDSLFTIIAAQTVVQGSYVLGLLAQAAINSHSQRQIL